MPEGVAQALAPVVEGAGSLSNDVFYKQKHLSNPFHHGPYVEPDKSNLPERVIRKHNLPEESYAAKSIREWELIGPYMEQSTEKQWEAYYKSRAKEEKMGLFSNFDKSDLQNLVEDYKEHLACQFDSEPTAETWKSEASKEYIRVFDYGECDKFRRSCRIQFVQALVSSGADHSVALLVASGLCIMMFSPESECFDHVWKVPRSINVHTRIFSACAQPCAVDLVLRQQQVQNAFSKESEGGLGSCEAVVVGPWHSNSWEGTIPLEHAAANALNPMVDFKEEPKQAYKGQSVKLFGSTSGLNNGSAVSNLLHAVLGINRVRSSRKAMSIFIRAAGITSYPVSIFQDADKVVKLNKENALSNENVDPLQWEMDTDDEDCCDFDFEMYYRSMSAAYSDSDMSEEEESSDEEEDSDDFFNWTDEEEDEIAEAETESGESDTFEESDSGETVDVEADDVSVLAEEKPVVDAVEVKDSNTEEVEEASSNDAKRLKTADSSRSKLDKE